MPDSLNGLLYQLLKVLARTNMLMLDWRAGIKPTVGTKAPCGVTQPVEVRSMATMLWKVSSSFAPYLHASFALRWAGDPVGKMLNKWLSWKFALLLCFLRAVSLGPFSEFHANNANWKTGSKQTNRQKKDFLNFLQRLPRLLEDTSPGAKFSYYLA